MFTIDETKLEKIVEIFNLLTGREATDYMLSSTILADWNEGDEHQEWIDTASEEEIAGWLVYTNW